VDETEYWESRLCRLLENPVVYQLVVLLNNGGAMTRSKLAKAVGRPVQTVSGHLAKLRAANLVRYGEKRVFKDTYSSPTLKTL
jgi:DNA-binding transcriptional ArsR family regulator